MKRAAAAAAFCLAEIALQINLMTNTNILIEIQYG